MARQFNSITVEDLINQLKDLPQDAKIGFACNYGDYGRTMQVLPFGEEPELVFVQESAYSQSGFAIDKSREADEVDEEDIDEDDGERVFVIRA